jgi:hypothetical protein
VHVSQQAPTLVSRFGRLAPEPHKTLRDDARRRTHFQGAYATTP